MQAVLLAVPFALRLLQAVRKEGAIARQDGRFRAGMVQLGRGEYNGWAGWRRARDELGWTHGQAAFYTAARFFFWHLMQPAVYFWVLFAFVQAKAPTPTEGTGVSASATAVNAIRFQCPSFYPSVGFPSRTRCRR